MRPGHCPPKRACSQGTEMEQTQAHRAAPNEPEAPLSCSERRPTCSAARQRTVVPRSGRRGRRFKSCHPEHCHPDQHHPEHCHPDTVTPTNVSAGERPARPPPPQPRAARRNKEEHSRNAREHHLGIGTAACWSTRQLRTQQCAGRGSSTARTDFAPQGADERSIEFNDSGP